jgi:hypothetical protein
MGGVEHAQQVHAHHLVPVVERGVLDGAEQPHARIVHQDIQPPPLRHRARDGCLRLGLVGHVGLKGQRVPTASRNVLRQLLQALLAPRREGDGGPLSGQRAGGGRADATAGAGDQRHRPVKKSFCHGSVYRFGVPLRCTSIVRFSCDVAGAVPHDAPLSLRCGARMATLGRRAHSVSVAGEAYQEATSGNTVLAVFCVRHLRYIPSVGPWTFGNALATAIMRCTPVPMWKQGCLALVQDMVTRVTACCASA